MHRASTPTHKITKTEAAEFFNWEPVEAELVATIPGKADETITETTHEITDDGVTLHETYTVIPGTPTITLPPSNFKAIVRPPGSFGPNDPGAVLAVPTKRFQIHPYKTTLVDVPASLYDTDELIVNTMGYLDDGGVAWAQWRTPEPIDPAGTGYQLHPYITLSTSVNGKLATQAGMGNIVVVCSNSLCAFNAEANRNNVSYRRKHTANSFTDASSLNDLRTVLGIVRAQTDLTVAAIDQLANTTVTSSQWDAFLEQHAPTYTPTSEATGSGTILSATLKTGRALTVALNLQTALDDMYRNDSRVTPWAGTALGVLQAVNTHETWETTVQRSTTRDDRNADRMVRNQWAKLDAEVLAELDRVLDTDLASLVAV